MENTNFPFTCFQAVGNQYVSCIADGTDAERIEDGNPQPATTAAAAGGSQDINPERAEDANPDAPKDNNPKRAEDDDPEEPKGNNLERIRIVNTYSLKTKGDGPKEPEMPEDKGAEEVEPMEEDAHSQNQKTSNPQPMAAKSAFTPRRSERIQARKMAAPRGIICKTCHGSTKRTAPDAHSNLPPLKKRSVARTIRRPRRTDISMPKVAPVRNGMYMQNPFPNCCTATKRPPACRYSRFYCRRYGKSFSREFQALMQATRDGGMNTCKKCTYETSHIPDFVQHVYITHVKPFS